MEKVNLAEKFGAFTEHWRPKIVGELNGQEAKLVKFRGLMRVEFCDRVVELKEGEFLVVPRGLEHRTAADEEAEVLLFEPAATRNTGSAAESDFTAPEGVRI